MTKEEFSKFPPMTIHYAYGQSHFKIREDNKYTKAACYINHAQYKSGLDKSNSWDNLYKEICTYLKKEGHIK